MLLFYKKKLLYLIKLAVNYQTEIKQKKPEPKLKQQGSRSRAQARSEARRETRAETRIRSKSKI